VTKSCSAESVDFQLSPHTAVEALAEAVLHRLARHDETPFLHQGQGARANRRRGRLRPIAISSASNDDAGPSVYETGERPEGSLWV
jgi:hypothetical protein